MSQAETEALRLTPSDMVSSCCKGHDKASWLMVSKLNDAEAMLSNMLGVPDGAVPRVSNLTRTRLLAIGLVTASTNAGLDQEAMLEAAIEALRREFAVSQLQLADMTRGGGLSS